MWKPITIQISLPAGIAPSSDLLHYLLNANSVFLKESTPQKRKQREQTGPLFLLSCSLLMEGSCCFFY